VKAKTRSGSPSDTAMRREEKPQSTIDRTMIFFLEYRSAAIPTGNDPHP
jgi:hypothetical protein